MRGTTDRVGVPSLALNLYDTPTLRDSRDSFAQIREAGPVVWLARHRMYAIGRFADVRAALRDDARLQSGHGVAANPIANRLGRHTTLFSDQDTHRDRRTVMMHSLGAAALKGIDERVTREATAVIDALAAGGGFDAVADFSAQLPTRIVAELVGVPEDPQRLLRWAAGTFDSLGPVNLRGLRAAASSLGLLAATRRLSAGRVRAGSWAAAVFEAHARGEVSAAEARALCIDFIAPALDTTILASTHLLWALARHPESWQQIRADPSLIPRAVVENVRIASPIRGFTRRVAQTHEVAGATLPAGARVLLLYGAANLDETEFPDPEAFSLSRENRVQLGWGNGAHTCVGIHLAKLEMQALLRAMVGRVESIAVRDARRLENNTLQGIARMRARFTPAATI